MNAEMTHTDSALAVARNTGWNVDEYAEERGWSGVALGPVGQHRDSPALDRSNFEVVREELGEKFGDAVETVSFGHWGVGWVEEIASDAGRADIQTRIAEIRAALEDYPVADESHFSELEMVESIETITACRSSSIERDGIRYELSDLLPDDYAERTFSEMFEAGDDTSPDGMRGDAIDAAMLALGFYVPEEPLVLLANLPTDEEN